MSWHVTGKNQICSFSFRACHLRMMFLPLCIAPCLSAPLYHSLLYLPATHRVVLPHAHTHAYLHTHTRCCTRCAHLPCLPAPHTHYPACSYVLLCFIPMYLPLMQTRRWLRAGVGRDGSLENLIPSRSYSLLHWLPWACLPGHPGDRFLRDGVDEVGLPRLPLPYRRHAPRCSFTCSCICLLLSLEVLEGLYLCLYSVYVATMFVVSVVMGVNATVIITILHYSYCFDIPLPIHPRAARQHSAATAHMAGPFLTPGVNSVNVDMYRPGV